MIENQGAVDNLDAILDVEGLDGAFVGNSILPKLVCGFKNAKCLSNKFTYSYSFNFKLH